MLDAAAKAPNGGNLQPARFLVLRDRDHIRAFGALYREAWWAKRREGPGWKTIRSPPLVDRAHRRRHSHSEYLPGFARSGIAAIVWTREEGGTRRPRRRAPPMRMEGVSHNVGGRGGRAGNGGGTWLLP
jgi:hypothetical protein